MFGARNLGNVRKANEVRFVGAVRPPESDVSIQAWTRPKHATMLFFLCIGGGAGGGSGKSGPLSTARGGGGGGGTGSTIRWLVPAALLPRVLYLGPGSGGPGGVATGGDGGAGMAGGPSIIAMNPIDSASARLVRPQSGATGGGGGVVGNPVPGVGESVGVNSGPGATLGLYAVRNGRVGGGDVYATQVQGSVVTGGAGGGTVNVGAGNFGTAGDQILLSVGALPGGLFGGGAGSSGYVQSGKDGFFSFGGTGGGGHGTGTGGRGGDGAIGAGGGGGGGGVTGGAGGNGGPGMILIVWW